ncbi:hypothetical protein GJAV_G00202270 [Gymnothorax javanicus]|nr:hypothetical protein GJAV_G00202270 [Gymnothorax javanicus]
MRLLIYTTFLGFFLKTGGALQIQCYQCEEVKHNDCSTPEFIVNCTVNVQDMCQKEVLVKEDETALVCHRVMWIIHATSDKHAYITADKDAECRHMEVFKMNVTGVHYRKSCASSGACLIASSGYQQFCTGKLHSVCISCCNTPLCNGPRQKKRPALSAGPLTRPFARSGLFLISLFTLHTPPWTWVH